LGRLLLTSIIQEAQNAGNTTLRLDSTPFMTQAHALYRSFGFVVIEPYPQSAVPEEWHASWTFMELQLDTLQRDDGRDGAI
jgi:ribosomal protein S18 acetylase RimI-like enzyme